MADEVLMIGGAAVLVCDDHGALLSSENDATGLLGDAWGRETGWVAVPTGRLDPAFFDLSTRLAGGFIQKFVTYGVRLAIVGDISAAVAESGALRDFVRESNDGAHVWFTSDLAELEVRLMPAKITIETFHPGHAAAWRSLNADWLIAGGYVLEAKDELVLGDPQGAILDRGGYIFIAERDGEPVGCCSLMAMGDGGFEVGKMAVLPEARGLNLGHRLLEACEGAARKTGAPRLYLETNKAQSHAIALYRRFGFVDLPPRASPYARADVWMEKRLRAATPSTDPDAGTGTAREPEGAGSRSPG